MVFTAVDHLIDEVEGHDSGFGLVAAVTPDGVPENVTLGVTLVGGAQSLSLLAAIFASNFPEALGGARGIVDDRSKRYAVGVWTATELVPEAYGRGASTSASPPRSASCSPSS